MESVRTWLFEKGLYHWQVPGVVNGQIQEIWKPRLCGSSPGHEEKLGVGLGQLGQVLGEELVSREGVCPQILPWQEEGVYHQQSGI